MLENALRDKIRTGEELKLEQLDIEPSSRSLERSENESKQLNNLSKHRRMETINVSKRSSQPEFKKGRFNYDNRKSSIGNDSVMIIENQLMPQKSVELKKKLTFKSTTKDGDNSKLKSTHRYKNSSMIENYSPKPDKFNNHNMSTITPKKNNFENDQKLRRFAEVNSSVEEHLRKYEYLIPDVRKK